VILYIFNSSLHRIVSFNYPIHTVTHLTIMLKIASVKNPIRNPFQCLNINRQIASSTFCWFIFVTAVAIVLIGFIFPPSFCLAGATPHPCLSLVTLKARPPFLNLSTLYTGSGRRGRIFTHYCLRRIPLLRCNL